MKELFFTQGVWFGKGTLTLSMLEDILPIWIRFEMVKESPDEMELKGTSEYHIIGYNEPVINHYTFTHFFKNKFEIIIENEAWGKAVGQGFIEDNTIGFEFQKGAHGFEGYESYTFVDDHTVLLKGAFLTDEELSSEISAKVVRNVEAKAAH